MKVGYITLGTNDLEKACAFYDQLMETIGCLLYTSDAADELT